jgi:hypothetical protein
MNKFQNANISIKKNEKQNNNNYCLHCGKKYTRKSSYEKHIIVCDIIYKKKREIIIEEEETNDLPSHKQLYQIIQELAFKYDKLNEKMEHMQKWINNKKKKINICEWLKENIKPSNNFDFDHLIDKIVVNQTHNNELLENNFMQSITLIFQEYFNEISQNKQNNFQPIYCFTEKNNIFYIFKNDEWREIQKEELIQFLNLIQKRMLNELMNWKNINSDKINSSDKWAEIYNKALIKLMVSFRDNNILGRVKTILYNILKKDLKNITEYEFEF